MIEVIKSIIPQMIRICISTSKITSEYFVAIGWVNAILDIYNAINARSEVHTLEVLVAS